MVKPDAVLVVGPSWVGDMVMAQSLFMSLRSQHPAMAIDVIAPAWSVGLLGRMPEVRNAFVLDVKHGELGLRKRWQLAKRLRQQDYQQAIILPRSFKSALVPFWAKVPVRTGFKTEMRYGLINDLRRLDSGLDQTVKRFVALGCRQETIPDASQCPRPTLNIDAGMARKLRTALNLTTDHPVVGFMPGAEYGPAKQWPVEHFIQLAKNLASHGFTVWVFGSGKEESLGQEIADKAGEHVVNLCGKTRLPDVIDLISLTRVAISNDSGLMHIAAATGRPLIALYGSSSPAFTPPLSEQAHIEYLNLDCSPCFQRQCRFGHYACLRDISVEQVLRLVLSAANKPLRHQGH